MFRFQIVVPQGQLFLQKIIQTMKKIKLETMKEINLVAGNLIQVLEVAQLFLHPELIRQAKEEEALRPGLVLELVVDRLPPLEMELLLGVGQVQVLGRDQPTLGLPQVLVRVLELGRPHHLEEAHPQVVVQVLVREQVLSQVVEVDC
jgi:hypothetical protein